MNGKYSFFLAQLSPKAPWCVRLKAHSVTDPFAGGLSAAFSTVLKLARYSKMLTPPSSVQHLSYASL